jgi:hypothetical protein
MDFPEVLIREKATLNQAKDDTNFGSYYPVGLVVNQRASLLNTLIA